MHDEPSGMTPQREDDLIEHLVLRELLEDETPGVWSEAELARAVGDPIKAQDALARLHWAGLVHRHGEFVWPTRSAARAVRIAGAV